MSVPLHWTADDFAGRFDEEASLLALAAELETAQPWFDCVPAVTTHGTDHSLHDGLQPLAVQCSQIHDNPATTRGLAPFAVADGLALSTLRGLATSLRQRGSGAARF
jgi:hypothetical protein